MISPILATHDADTTVLDFGVFVAERAQRYRTSQSAIIAALLPVITPSQPLQAPSHAPAADTSTMPPVDEKAERVRPALSAAPIPDIVIPISPEPRPETAVQTVASVNSSFPSPVESGTVAISTLIPPSPLAGDPAVEAGSPPNPVASSSAAFSPARGRPETTRAKIVACHHENPSWPSKLIAEHLNISEDAVRATASRKGLKLVSWWDHQRAVAKQTIAALKAEVAPSVQPIPSPPPATIPEPAIVAPAPSKPEPLGKRIAAYVAEHPSATLKDVTEALGAKMQAVGWAAQKAGIALRKYTAEERSEATSKGIQARKATPAEPARSLMPRADAIQPDETVMSNPQAMRQYRPAPISSARFHLRERDGQQRYVHQSLAPCPTGPGPLMTDDRKWAWFDNAQRYRGALNKWPEIATMRKVAP